MGARPLPADNGSSYTTIAGRGRHERRRCGSNRAARMESRIAECDFEQAHRELPERDNIELISSRRRWKIDGRLGATPTGGREELGDKLAAEAVRLVALGKTRSRASSTVSSGLVPPGSKSAKNFLRSAVTAAARFTAKSAALAALESCSMPLSASMLVWTLISGALPCGGRARRGGFGVVARELRHEKIRAINLDLSWNSTRQPVLHPLLPTWLLKPQKLGNLRGATEIRDDLFVVGFLLHSEIKHHV